MHQPIPHCTSKPGVHHGNGRPTVDWYDADGKWVRSDWTDDQGYKWQTEDNTPNAARLMAALRAGTGRGR